MYYVNKHHPSDVTALFSSCSLCDSLLGLLLSPCVIVGGCSSGRALHLSLVIADVSYAENECLSTLAFVFHFCIQNEGAWNSLFLQNKEHEFQQLTREDVSSMLNWWAECHCSPEVLKNLNCIDACTIIKGFLNSMGLIQRSSLQQYSAAETSLKTEGIDAVRSAEMGMHFKCDTLPIYTQQPFQAKFRCSQKCMCLQCFCSVHANLTWCILDNCEELLTNALKQRSNCWLSGWKQPKWKIQRSPNIYRLLQYAIYS